MKYIHIVQFHLMSGGGVGSVLTDLCQEMAKSSTNIYIISLVQSKKINFVDNIKWAEQYGIHSELIQNENESLIKVLFALRKRIKQLAKEDDLCLFLHLKMGVLFGILGSIGIKRIKRIEVYHSGYMNYKLQAFLSRSFIDNYIAVSSEAKSQLINWFKVKPSKVYVVYNGVDIDSIRLKCRDNEISNHGKRYISVGRLSFEKNFLIPISAFARLKENGFVKSSTYMVVGDGNQIEEAIEASNNYVDFTGAIPRCDVYGKISMSDVVILPSLWEGNSILLLEVLAIGKAVIVSDIPSFREVLNFEPLNNGSMIKKEKFGIVFNKESVDSCMEAIKCFDNLSISEVIEMGNYVKKFAPNYSIKNQSTQYFFIAES